MAARTSAGVGTVTTIVILSLTTAVFFVLFAIYFGRASDAQRQIADMQAQNADLIGAERNRDDIRVLTEQAKRSEHRTLVGYLAAQREALLQRVVGDRRADFSAIDQRLSGVEGSDQPLLAMIQTREARIADLGTQLQQAAGARDQAQAALSAEIARMRAVEESYRQSLDQVRGEVDQYKNEVAEYRTGADNFRAAQSAQVERFRTEAQETESRLTGEIRRLTEEKLILEAQLASLRGQRRDQMFRGQDEASLVDGRVISINEADRSVVLDIGTRQRVVLGQTFAVYATPSAIRPNDAGEYPAGKATLEVISVGETTSTARITSELRGNPVVRGDVIANAVYDPSKVYRFVIFGNFDANRDGVATPAETQQISSMIRAWGGEVTDDLSGDTDFLVLGERPVLPPRPGSDAPLEVALEFRRRQEGVLRYDALLRQSQTTGIPVLNENRLYTLIGMTPAPRRAAR